MSVVYVFVPGCICVSAHTQIYLVLICILDVCWCTHMACLQLIGCSAF